ncbi:hypothetical protein D3C78_1589100 [compost metagenome]
MTENPVRSGGARQAVAAGIALQRIGLRIEGGLQAAEDRIAIAVGGMDLVRQFDGLFGQDLRIAERAERERCGVRRPRHLQCAELGD